ncbi:sortilin, putative [Babesia bigemina]|uniref:Sortilin, putative n=1 Tax=Babesia bigemina TaxID=5866 RepID=A0A061D3Z7_BABBI|nr:sortilin, putative [Babesia bigemina]CDR95451.1 sortilin, putative [Babesia bigemina]|eukprot:XP_012767637.1 sortilin, putative [Babesia bigemina]
MVPRLILALLPALLLSAAAEDVGAPVPENKINSHLDISTPVKHDDPTHPANAVLQEPAKVAAVAEPSANESATGVAAGKKVSVTEISFDSLIDDLVWCGNNHTTVLLKTQSGRLYRSSDGGIQWTEITHLFQGSARNGSYKVDSVVVCETDKNVVVVIGDSKTHFISGNAGRSFVRLEFEGTINMWLFHPLKPSWALLSSWEGACFANENDEDCVHSIFVTRDMGRTFDRVARYVAQFSWGDITTNSEDRIYYSRYSIESGDQPKQDGWNNGISFMCTDDFGYSSSVIMEGGNKFLVSGNYVFVARVADPVRQTVNLYVSTDNAVTFNKAELPVELEERSYTILDTSEGAVIIHVGHEYEGGDIEVGNVYISDASGLRYSLSLPNNIRSASGECEFDKVYSLEGVYIANFRDDSGGMLNPRNKFKTHLDGTKTQIDQKRNRHVSHSKVEPNIRTVVSFNKGAEWHYLQPPKVNSEGKPYDCEEGKCFLHLHGITQYKNFAPFYSVEQATGLVLATGNVGDRLRFDPSQVNTFLSRDGGLTWTEAHKGAFIYEFGDYGGLIVMAQDQKKTKEVIFSWNEGATWFDFSLSKHDVSVNNVVIEPKCSSLNFILYGNRNGIGVAFHLDFSSLGQPLCKGIWSIDSSSSDYETWHPTDPHGNHCLLGRKMVYKRRKQASECFNGKEFRATVEREVCNCTPDDYECEIGFTRAIGSNTCKIDGTWLMREGCTSSSFFWADAYRKIPGDVCTAGWIPHQVAVPCPPHSPLSKGSKAVLSTIMVLAIIMMAIVYISHNDKLKHLFHNYGFKQFNYVAYTPVNAKKAAQRGAGFGGRFEPELGFIDAEQEQDEPTLLNYLSGNRAASNSQQQQATRGEQRQIELL